MAAKNTGRDGPAEEVRALKAALEETRKELESLRRRMAKKAVRGRRLDLFRALVEKSNDLVYTVDARGVVTFCGSQVALYGYTPEEVVGRPMTDFIHPEDAARVAADLQRLLISEEPFRSQFRIIRKDGTEAYVEDFGRVVWRRGRGLAFGGMLRDVTEQVRIRKEIERLRDDLERRVRERTAALEAEVAARQDIEVKLRLSEQWHRHVFETAPLALITWDRDRRVLDWNRAAEAIFGWTREEVLGRDMFEFLIPPTEHRELIPVAEDIFAGGPPSHRINQNLTKDGRVITCEWNTAVLRDASGRAVGALSIGMDITERLRAEAALERSRETLRLLVNNAKDAIFRFELDKGYTFISPSCERLLGYPPGRYRGDPHFFTAITHPDDRIRLHGLFAALRRGAEPPETIELRQNHSDGRLVHVEMTLRAARDESGRIVGIEGVSRDITDRRRIQDALQESEAKYRSLVEETDDGIFSLDQGGRFTFVNGAIVRRSGRSREWFLSHTYLDFVPPAHREESIERVGAALRGEVPPPMQLHYEGAANRPVWLEITVAPILKDGRVVGVRGMSHDITESHLAELAIRENRRRLETLMSNLPGMAYRCRNDRDWTMEFVSGGALALTGHPPEDLVGNRRISYGNLIHPDDRQMVWDGVQAAVAERRPYQLEYRIRTASGAEKWVWEQGSGVFSESGQLLALEGFITDITARVHAENKLRDSEAKYRALFEQAADSVVVFDPETRQILDFNERAHTTLGYTRDEFARLWLSDIEVIESPEEIMAHLRRIIETGADTFETQQRTKDGRILDVLVKARAVSVGDRRYIQGVWLDITEQRRAERQLRESEARHRSLFENSAIGMYRTTPDGRVLAANPALLAMLGYSSFEELTQRNLEENGYEPGYSRAAFKEQVEREGRVIGIESAWVRRDGTTLFVRESATAIRDDSGKTIHYEGTVEDITARRLAEDALRKSEERYRAIYDAIPDAIVFYDPATLRLVDANDIAVELYGYSRQEIQAGAVGILDIVAESERARVSGEIAALSSAGYPLIRYGPRAGRTKAGATIWADVTAAPIEIEGRKLRIIIIRDVTEIVRSRQRIDQQAMFLTNVSDAIITITPDRGVIYWNRGAEQVFGYSERDMTGRETLPRLFPNRDYFESLRGEVEGALARGETWSRDRVPCRHKDGRDLWVSMRATPLPPTDSIPVGALVVARDITDEVDLTERLVRSSHLAAVGTLALGVGHELNNMLHGLRNLGMQAEKDPAYLPQLLSACQTVAERGAAIANRMTLISRAEEPGAECLVNLGHVAQTVAAMMAPALVALDIRIETAIQPVPPTWVNEGAVLQVLLNLVMNARDSIGRDGSIRVSVSHDPAAGEIAIAVRDTGTGIRPEDMPRLFEPFFTTKHTDGPDGAEPSHLGLGLSESLSIVKAWGGSIDVESAPGAGATFIVRLPVRAGAAEAAGPTSLPLAPPPPGTKMLLVDDDDLVRRVVAGQLADAGYDVTSAATTEEALDLYRAKVFDYAFLDVFLGGEIHGGLGLCRTIRELHPAVRIIIATAFPEDDIPADCRKAAFAILRKPFTMDDIRRALSGRGQTK